MGGEAGAAAVRFPPARVVSGRQGLIPTLAGQQPYKAIVEHDEEFFAGLGDPGPRGCGASFEGAVAHFPGRAPPRASFRRSGAALDRHCQTTQVRAHTAVGLPARARSVRLPHGRMTSGCLCAPAAVGTSCGCSPRERGGSPRSASSGRASGLRVHQRCHRAD